MHRAVVTAVLALTLGCSSAPPPAPSMPPASDAAPPPPPAPPPAPPEATAKPPLRKGTPCGALECLELEAPRDAFELAIQGDPLVVAVGESHAQKDGPRVVSATRRFGSELLPALAGRAKDLVIELVVPDKKCRGGEVAAAKERTKEVTEPQAEGNQNEFLALGFEAKKLGIRPEPLVPSCEELASVVKAGQGDIGAMLTLIAEMTARETIAFLAHGNPRSAVVTYGGLVHNDLVPREGREEWSFGPRLSRHVGGRYVEIDLIVPEYVRDTESWRGLPWYPHYDPARHGKKTVLFRPAPASFVLIFPRSANVDPEKKPEKP